MSHAVRNLLKLVERFDDGDKIGASCIRLQTVEDLEVLAEQALKQALDEVAKTKIKRVGVPRETPEHPAYMPLEHASLDGRAWQTLLATSSNAF